MIFKGKVNTAICYAKVIEPEAVEQIRRLCDYEMTKGSRIRIMSDVHARKGCTIGTTMTIIDKAVPNCRWSRYRLWNVYSKPRETGRDAGRSLLSVGRYLDDYLHDVAVCQAFARRNREIMALLIPVNMRDGSILAVGKGNPEWNDSAPHGAGRVMSRTRALQELTMRRYKKAMKGIYTTSVNERTLDEAPMAYKSLGDILDVIQESVEIKEILKPVYNFKASE